MFASSYHKNPFILFLMLLIGYNPSFNLRSHEVNGNVDGLGLRIIFRVADVFRKIRENKTVYV